MLDAGGGGGYGGTNWSAASVTDMWLAVANQDTTPHWQLLSGWRKSYELTLQHMAQVKNYRENLATAWPPEKSPAAAAYLARLDVLIDHLQQTYDAAVANHSAFSNATSAISSARAKLEKVVNEYLANKGKLDTFAQEQAERPKGGLQRGPEPKPPVADGRQVQLEAQARSIMYGLSTEISQARTQITKPTLYDPLTSVNDDRYDRDGAAYSAPPIPPVVPFTPGSSSSSTSVNSPATTPFGTNLNTATPSPTTRQPGLILGGLDSPITPPPPTPTPPVLGAPPPITTPGPGTLPQVPITPSPVPLPPNANRGTPSVPVPPNAGNWNGNVRAMPPGGVIGGPAMGLGQPVSTRPTPSVNPVGGVISPGNRAAIRGDGGRGALMAGMPPSRPSEASGERSEVIRWDPDNPWETAEGVSPVVVPLSEQRVNPGPAIGLD